jgi:hypothetical protein
MGCQSAEILAVPRNPSTSAPWVSSSAARAWYEVLIGRSMPVSSDLLINSPPLLLDT